MVSLRQICGEIICTRNSQLGNMWCTEQKIIKIGRVNRDMSHSAAECFIIKRKKRLLDTSIRRKARNVAINIRANDLRSNVI